MRDTQRARVYRAEAGSTDGDELDLLWHEHLISIAQAERFVNQIARRVANRRRFGMLPRIKVVKRANRDGGYAAMARGNSRIEIKLLYCRRILLIHELAHLYTPDMHGRNFCRVYLGLVRNVFGPSVHAILRESFRIYRVKYTRRRIPNVMQIAAGASHE